MPDRATAMNPRVLMWARERIGLTIQDAARHVGRPAEVVTAWEAGEAAPTFRQLEALARAFKRPVAVFFFPDPPEEPDPRTEFRTLPESEFEAFAPDTLLALREGHAWQASLRELSGGVNPADRQILDDISASLDEPAEDLAAKVREYLGVDLADQFGWNDASEAFKEWRSAVEAVGVFVFKRSLAQRSISGFCLHDAEFPLILINNSTAHSRQIFTLFHELGHLLFSVSGVTPSYTTDLRGLSDVDREIEIRCNRFAAEFLVPDQGFPWAAFRRVDWVRALEVLARQYNVSREVVLRKLVDQGAVASEVYQPLAEQWNQEYEESRRGRKPGGDYYATQATYLGDSYLRLAFGQYHAGRLSLPELADHLGMKARNVSKLQDFLLTRK